MSPKSNVLNASAGDQGEVLDDAIECTGIQSLPDAPGNGGADDCFLIASASQCPQVCEAGEGVSFEIRVEEVPNFACMGAQQEEVICIFILRAGETGISGAEMVSEPPLIGGEALLRSQPTENLALEGGGALPNVGCYLVDLQMPERIGVDTFVREFFVSEAAATSIMNIMA
jgi:hypothetical protein